MFDKLNPFKKAPPANPLESLSEDGLRTARKKLEFNRDRLLRQVRELETQKTRLLEEGAQAELRVRKDKAYQIKSVEEQIGQVDHQLTMMSRQVQFINRLLFVKQNSQQVGALVIDQLLGGVDMSKLRGYIEDITVRGMAGADRLDDLASMLDLQWNVVVGNDDPEISKILATMESMSLPTLPELGSATEVNRPPQSSTTRDESQNNPPA